MISREARNDFGELMDTTQREPITIEKHGRPSVVEISATETEYDAIKLERLRARLAIGAEQARQGMFSEMTADDIIREGMERLHAKKSIDLPGEKHLTP